MNRYKDIIFDVDGTLWDTTDLVAVSWNDAVRDMRFQADVITGNRLKQEFGKPMDVIAEDLFPHIPLREREKLMEVCCQYEDEYLEESSENMMYFGVRETFEALAKDHRLFIVSNCQSGYIEQFLRKNNLGRLVTDIECFGNTKKSKAENIRLIMERNHITSACYVGDTTEDFSSAKEAGLPFIFAAYGFGDVSGADYSIDEMNQLLTIVK